MEYIDSHAHITCGDYENLEEMLAQCEENHVKRIMIMCCKESELEKAYELHDKDPYRFQIAYGIHPEDADEAESRFEEMKRIVSDTRIACVGEIGLDYYWRQDNIELQKEYFIKQIEVAREVHKPILVHARDAMQDTYDILKEHRVEGVLHCYSGSKEMAREFVKLGYYISIGGPVTFKNARHSVEVVKDIDLNYLLSETDSPYMAPAPYRGKQNAPFYIPHIVAKMAELREMSVEEMASILSNNYKRLLGE